jgi:hypothetical protein
MENITAFSVMLALFSAIAALYFGVKNIKLLRKAEEKS